MKMFKGLMDSIKNSVKDHLGKESSARISSYIVLAFIIINSLVFMIIEVVNASVMWSKGEPYVIPSEHIWIFGLILSHHLGLLFYKSKEYNGTNEFVVKPNLGEVKDSLKPTSNVAEEVVYDDEPIVDDYIEDDYVDDDCCNDDEPIDEYPEGYDPDEEG